MDNKNNEAVDGVVASEEISLEEQQAVLEKFDQESNTRNVTGFAKGFIKWYAIAMAVFHVYTSFFGLWATNSPEGHAPAVCDAAVLFDVSRQKGRSQK